MARATVHNSMQKKDDKVGNEDANKEERQSKKGEQEKEMEIDSKKNNNKKNVQILAFAHARKTKEPA